MSETNVDFDRLVSALKVGGQISNGHQTISFWAGKDRGYLCCDTPGCCDSDFDGMQEILDFISGDDEWEVVSH